MKSLLALIALMCTAIAADARCPSFEQMIGVASAYADRTPVDALPPIASVADAYCAQGMLTAVIGRQKGVPAGFRTERPAASDARDPALDPPLHGLLYTDMFLHDNARVPANYAAAPRITTELYAVVLDHDLQKAHTPLEALRHIAYFVPVFELSDGMVAHRPPSTLESIATNLGTRLAVIGTPIPVEATEEFLDRLGHIEVEVVDSSGQLVAHGRTGASAAHPVEALLWLAHTMQYNATRIIAGDRLGLGALSQPIVSSPGLELTAKYSGPGIDGSVSVRFTATLDRGQADIGVLEPPALPGYVKTMAGED